MTLSAEEVHSLPRILPISPILGVPKAGGIDCRWYCPRRRGSCICSMRDYKAMAQWRLRWAKPGRPRAFWLPARERALHRPARYVIRDCMVRVGPAALDQGLQAWQATRLAPNEALAMDGKIMKGAVDETGAPTHIVSLLGHDSKHCATKKVGALKRDDSDEAKRTNESGMAIPLPESCAIAGRDMTADALLTQRAR